MKRKRPFLQIFFIALCVQLSICGDITSMAFGSKTDVMPAAFGDFNSDELTDLFVISEDLHSIQILLATTKETYFETNEKLRCDHGTDYQITSIAPGDFDGDALMDVLVTARKAKDNINLSNVFIHWGTNFSLNCTTTEILRTFDEPLVIDYRTDMITDLFGIDENGTRTLWIFDTNRTHSAKPLSSLDSKKRLRLPHSNAFLDLNDDNAADLYLTGETDFEIWFWDTSNLEFELKPKIIKYPKLPGSDKPVTVIGQTLFLDLETNDQINQVVPVCTDERCTESYICVYVFAVDKWYYLNVSFKDSLNTFWGFAKSGPRYTDTITLRASDFNNDGYVDLLATLQSSGSVALTKTFLLENVPCQQQPCDLKRTFQVRWDALSPNNENAVMGAFYDFMQDGIMDVIFVQSVNGMYNVSAFKNSLDYDANFIKVMVISGISKTKNKMPSQSLLGTKRFFSSNLPGPKVRYQTTTQDGNRQAGQSSQLPQSAHFALYLPYTIFGLGRTPNFVEYLDIGMFNQTKQLSPIIPNSQLVIIIPDNQATNPAKWRAQLFVTPSKIIVQTVGALVGICLVLAIIIGVLHWKERREDKIERLQEAHRFHFDAM